MTAPPIIEHQGGLQIVRDDLFAGGSKRRALLRWLPELNQSHFNYVGTVFGSGAWALAEACHDLGFTCTLHFAKNKYQPPWLDILKCEIVWHEPQPVQQICENVENALPLGYHHPDFIRHMADIFRETIAGPEQIWLPCVGGTLVEAAKLAWPNTDIRAVCVAKNVFKLEDVTYYQAPEKYHQPARQPPPYSACPFSDGKVWQFAREFALSNAHLWNVSA